MRTDTNKHTCIYKGVAAAPLSADSLGYALNKEKLTAIHTSILLLYYMQLKTALYVYSTGLQCIENMIISGCDDFHACSSSVLVTK